jgi:hypothetical protein
MERRPAQERPLRLPWLVRNPFSGPLLPGLACAPEIPALAIGGRRRAHAERFEDLGLTTRFLHEDRKRGRAEDRSCKNCDGLARSDEGARANGTTGGAAHGFARRGAASPP